MAVTDWLAFKNVTSETVVLELLKFTLVAIVFMVTEQSIFSQECGKLFFSFSFFRVHMLFCFLLHALLFL